jgi:hypothetical protein
MRQMITTAALAAITALGLAGCDKDAESAAEGSAAIEADDGEAAPTPETARPEGRERRRGGERMAKFDSNGDGKLDESERAAMREGRVARILESADTDGDGAISKDEAAAVEGRQKRMFGDFSKLDADNDGSITKAELAESMKNRGPRRRRPR